MKRIGTGSTQETKTTLTSSTIDVSAADVFTYTVVANTTFTAVNPAPTGLFSSFILELTNGGAYTVTWMTGIKWQGGVSPSLTASGKDVLGFYTYDGGSSWYGTLISKDAR